MSEVTIVLSRAGDDNAMRQKFEDAVAAELAASGAPRVLIVPSIYGLVGDEEIIDAIKSIPGEVFFASWLYPRAAYWVLRKLGIDVTAGERKKSAGAGGKVRCFFFGAFDSADACAKELLRAAGLAPSPGSGGVKPEEVRHELRPRWYPVIDYLLCANCGRCHDFCLFGVYTKEDGRVVVSQPDNCKPGCPACARQCPEGALMFPLYDKDPVIAGDVSSKRAKVRLKVETPSDKASAKSRGGPRKPAAKKKSAKRPSSGAERDEIDDLIDRLDEMDV